jgi:TRAP-type transport system periplasmic protein
MQGVGNSIYAVAVATVMSLASSTRAEPLMLRIGSAIGPDHSSSKAVEIFRTELTRRTHCALDVAFFPAGTVGSGGVKELIEALRADTLFAVPASIQYFSRLVPETEALSLPFVFRDSEQARQATDGAVGKLIEARLLAKGFITLGWMALGARNVTNSKKPLKTLDDFKGLKIRVQPSETHIAIFRALGANPLAMDIKDVYTALQQGDVDAQENPYYPSYFYKFYNVQKYVSNTRHAFDFLVFVASKKAFTDLPPEQQKAVRDAARIASVQQWKMEAAEDEAALANLKANGMQFDPLPEASRTTLKKATAGVIESARKHIGADLLDQVAAANPDHSPRDPSFVRPSSQPASPTGPCRNPQ